jgi:hypothetical protein
MSIDWDGNFDVNDCNPCSKVLLVILKENILSLTIGKEESQLDATITVYW